MEDPSTLHAAMGTYAAPLVGVVVGALIGFLSAELRELLARRRIRHGHLEALRAELELCSTIAGWYLSEQYMAPAYRLPTVAFDRSLPLLLAEGRPLSEDDSSAIMQYYVTVKSFNLCLELVHKAVWEKHDSLGKQHSRAKIKARSLVSASDGPATDYHRAIAAIGRHLPSKGKAALHLKSGETDDGGSDDD